MPDFAYRGLPVEKDGAIRHVQPVRSIQAPNGKHYRGVLDVDSRGNEFTYNQFPGLRMSGDIPPWIIGESVLSGDLRVYELIAYKCLQAHVTQEDWRPPVTPSLWKIS